MSQPTVYLAGPITGLEYTGATGWRDFATCVFSDYDITGLSPMRHKEFLSGFGIFDARHHTNPLHTPSGVVARDYYDVKRCSLVLMNLLGATMVSIGSVFEAAWCVDLRKPLVMVIEPQLKLNPHDHWFMHQAASFVVPSLIEGIETSVAILKD